MSVQLAEPDSIIDNDHVDSPHGESDPELPITSEQSEPADHDESQSESGRLSLSELKVDENSTPQVVDEAPTLTAEAKPIRKMSVTSSKKGPMSVSTNTAKANGDPPTPLVKRIINSGTFGLGSVKPAPGVKTAVSGSAASTKPASSVSSLRRSTSAAPAASAKPTMASRTPATSAPAPSRRSSLVPTKPVTAVGSRNLLSSSVNSKPTTVAEPKARASVASPTGSVTSARSATAARPRASISEAAKKPPPTRTSTTGGRGPAATKPTTSTRTAPSAGKATSGSISSIKELKEDNKALADLQRQLNEVEESLKGKTESVGALEIELQKLQGSFQTALEDVQTKTAIVTELETAKAALEAQLQEAQGSLEEREAHDILLEQVKGEIESAKAAGQESASQVEKLQAQIIELEAIVTTTQESLHALQATHDAALADAAQSSSVEHEALERAKADFEAISKEVESLKAAHAESLQASGAKIAELEPKVAELESLHAQVEELKAEREENANKISELEVEVLELKEEIEGLEDTQGKLKTTITALEADLAKSAQLLEQSKKLASDQEVEAKVQLQNLRDEHANEVSALTHHQSNLQEELQAVKESLATAVAAQEQTTKDIAAAQLAHDEQVQQLEAANAAREVELNGQIAAIQESLDGQEASYNSKVQTVKDEHEVLLKEAFERAKDEAGAVHAQELRSLQEKSNTIMAEIQSQNKATLESMENDHAGELDSTVKDYTKQIGNLNLELKATRDDLTKSKAALEELGKELEAVKGQRDAARASAEAVPAVSPEHVEEVTRLSKELAVAKDDLAAVTDMLNLTKSSLTEMSEKHQKDIEEMGKSRVEETLKLGAAHDEEIQALAVQKSDLLVRLSDLEGDLSTVKAALAAAQTASPKTNGSVAPPTSPGVSKEELAKLHEAHTLKIYDLQADHEKELKALKEEVEKSHERANQLASEVERKNMEIKYLEQDLEENQSEITRLSEAVAEKTTA